ncbi:hypothetical protein SNE40_016514 [Patella caerulea]|uniref:Uncharacterized protein n=1 Tax=Patella caerulea TaxID=87958 RepID=A0AAN8J8R7_PATCE
MLLERSNQELENSITSQCVELNEEIDRLRDTGNSRFNNGVPNFLHYHIFVLENLSKEWNLKCDISYISLYRKIWQLMSTIVFKTMTPSMDDSDVESVENPSEDGDGDPTIDESPGELF